jgi:zinc protease
VNLRWLILCICVACLGGFAVAQSPIKEPPPEPAQARPFHLAARTHYALPNGMQVNLLRFGSVPKVSIEIDVSAGRVNEDPKQVDISAITAELMGQGTLTRSGDELALAAGDMGASLSIASGSYQSKFSLDVLSASAAGAISLLADVLRNPSFPAKEFERLGTDHLRTCETSLADPGFLARKKFAEIMYGDQADGRVLPTPEALKSYTLEDVRRYYKQNYGAQRTTIYVVGSFDERKIRKAVDDEFGSWLKGQAPDMPVETVSRGQHFAFIDQTGATQSNVIYGIAVPDIGSPDSTSLDVMDTLLGGSFGSRITANIREQHGYSYSPRSTLSQGYGSNIWSESAAITTPATGPAIQEISKEILKLQSNQPSATEVRDIEQYKNGVFILDNSSREGVLGDLSFVDFHHLGDDYLTGYVSRVQAVTPQQIQYAARKYLSIGAMTLVVVGDRSIALPQVSGFVPRTH